MKKKISLEEFEQKLISAGPHLAARFARKSDLSPARLEELSRKLEEIHPFLRELTVSQMRSLILSLLKEHPMDGAELCARLRKANIQLKEDGAGSGAIYGILHQLERLSLIRSEKREIDGQFLDVYSLTADGRNELNPEASELTKVAQWTGLVLAVHM